MLGRPALRVDSARSSQEIIGLYPPRLVFISIGRRNRRLKVRILLGVLRAARLLSRGSFRSPLGRKRDRASYVRTGVSPQISCAYSRIVRSLENFPMWATFRIDLRVQAARSRYVSSTRSW